MKDSLGLCRKVFTFICASIVLSPLITGQNYELISIDTTEHYHIEMQNGRQGYYSTYSGTRGIAAFIAMGFHNDRTQEFLDFIEFQIDDVTLIGIANGIYAYSVDFRISLTASHPPVGTQYPDVSLVTSFFDGNGVPIGGTSRTNMSISIIGDLDLSIGIIQGAPSYATPQSQTNDMSFALSIRNDGGQVQDDIEAEVEVIDTKTKVVVFSRSEHVGSISNGDSTVHRFQATYRPTSLGEYKIRYSVRPLLGDNTPNNNIAESQFEITQNTFAKDNDSIPVAYQPLNVSTAWGIGNYYHIPEDGYSVKNIIFSVWGENNSHVGKEVDIVLFKSTPDNDTSNVTNNDFTIVGQNSHTFSTENNYDLISVPILDFNTSQPGVKLDGNSDYVVMIYYPRELYAPCSRNRYDFELATVVYDDNRWYTRGFGPDITHVSRIEIEMSAPQTPERPILYRPLNNDTDIALDGRLIWLRANRADDYDVLIATDASFNNLVLDINYTGTTYGYSNLSESTTYYWRVRGNNISGPGNWSDTWEFTTISGKPEVPILESPINGKTDIPIQQALFTWDTSNNATHYELQISKTATFSSLVLSDDNINTTYTAVDLTEGNTIFYWRVRAHGSQGISDWSSVWSFVTINNHVAPPNLTSPMNGATDVPLNTSYTWQEAPSADEYTIEISRDPSFNSIVTRSTLSDNVFYYILPDANSIYHWRVKSLANGFESDWSSIWSFVTVSTTSNADLSINESLSIYPNPTSDEVIIDFDSPSSYLCAIKIYHTSGELCESINTQVKVGHNKITIDVSSLHPGAYLISITGHNETYIWKRFIKK